MTTDITELAQRMKAAAVRAKAATEDYVAHRMSITVCLEECKEFNDLSDGPDNILALVEALELKEEQRANWFQMAQKLGEDLDAAEKRNAELVEALEKAQTENTAGAAGMAESYETTISMLRSRIAEQESRTVKLPDDEDGQAYGFGKWSNSKLPATAGTMTIAYCEDAWRTAFEVFSSAAGIKVEGE